MDLPPDQQERIVCSITAAIKYEIPVNILLAVADAMEKLDLQTMQAVAIQLMLRDTEGAKDILVAHTDLTDAQINDLVDGVNQEVDRTIAKYQDKLNAATETIATYSQAVLWSVFAASAIGLVLSILGGLIGAATTKRLYVELVAK